VKGGGKGEDRNYTRFRSSGRNYSTLSDMLRKKEKGKLPVMWMKYHLRRESSKGGGGGKGTVWSDLAKKGEGAPFFRLQKERGGTLSTILSRLEGKDWSIIVSEGRVFII